MDDLRKRRKWLEECEMGWIVSANWVRWCCKLLALKP